MLIIFHVLQRYVFEDLLLEQCVAHIKLMGVIPERVLRVTRDLLKILIYPWLLEIVHLTNCYLAVTHFILF